MSNLTPPPSGSVPEQPRPELTPPAGPAPGYGTPGYRPPAAPPGAAPTYPTYPGSASYAPPYAGPAYPVSGYGLAAGPRAAGGQTNPLAVASLILSISGFTLLPFFGSIIGAVLGHVALGQIGRDGGEGRGIAITGIALGWGILALALVAGGLIFFVFGFAAWSQVG